MYNYEMKTAESIFSIRWTQIFCILASLYAVAVAVYIFVETGKPLGSRDFHQFWYAGHFILEGRDPYEAFFAKEPPSLPVVYLDGVTINQYPVALADLEITPSNTPMMLLLLSPFSYFSWGVAKWMILVVNLILMLVTGWLVIRHFPFRGIKLSPLDEVLVFLAYFDLSATRIAIENGLDDLVGLPAHDPGAHVCGTVLGDCRAVTGDRLIEVFALAAGIFIPPLQKKILVPVCRHHGSTPGCAGCRACDSNFALDDRC